MKRCNDHSYETCSFVYYFPLSASLTMTGFGSFLYLLSHLVIIFACFVSLLVRSTVGR